MKSTILLFLTASVTMGHRAIDCFKEGNLVGGAKKNGSFPFESSDLGTVLTIGKDHELTSIKVCTDRAVTYIRGIQVSYGKFNGIGEIVEAVSLNAFGDMNQASSLCTNFYIP